MTGDSDDHDRGFRPKPGVGHLQSELTVTFGRNDRSRSSGIGGHLGPEYASKCKLAVIPSAGRVIGAAFTAHGENLFWSNPIVVESVRTRERLNRCPVFSPELEYNWDGVPDWHTLQGYKVPRHIDPGAYEFVDEAPDVISLRATGSAPVHGMGCMAFEVVEGFA